MPADQPQEATFSNAQLTQLRGVVRAEVREVVEEIVPPIVEKIIDERVPAIIEQKVPGIVERIIEDKVPAIVERVTEPHFTAIQGELLTLNEKVDDLQAGQKRLEADVIELKDGQASIAKRQEQEQTMLDNLDTRTGKLEHQAA